MARTSDPRVFKVLRLCSLIREIGHDLPAYALEALLKVYAADVGRDDPMSTNELLDSLAPTSTSASHRGIAFLKSEGLVEGSRDSADGRVVRLNMTPQGVSVVQEMLQAVA